MTPPSVTTPHGEPDAGRASVRAFPLVLLERHEVRFDEGAQDVRPGDDAHQLAVIGDRNAQDAFSLQHVDYLVDSVVGVHGNPGQTNYSASKAGIIGFTKALARELGPRGVRANVIAPGYVETRLTDVLPEEARQAMLDHTPLARLGSPEDVAGAVRFLCSDEASFITGEVLLVDGGLGM